jgi:hypothetical protein
MKSGQFIRVRSDHDSPRAGKDGMVYDNQDDGHQVALIFEFDRHNCAQEVICVGPELWSHDELDLSTLD